MLRMVRELLQGKTSVLAATVCCGDVQEPDELAEVRALCRRNSSALRAAASVPLFARARWSGEERLARRQPAMGSSPGETWSGPVGPVPL